MAYDLEEQEQLAALKGWWKDNGTLLLAVVVAAALGFAGWQGWRAWQAKQSHEAGALYETLAKAMREGDAKAVREAGGALAEGFPRTVYASMGALAAAKFLFERDDRKGAAAQLQWVIEHAPSPEFADLARLRLAGVLLDEKSYDAALAALDAKHAAALDGQYAARRGDVLLAMGRREDAKAAYRAALEKSDLADRAFRASVQLRLDALGA